MSEFIDINRLKPHPENAKEHSPEQISRIGKSIDNLGWGRGLVISNDDYILIGHGAYYAAKGTEYKDDNDNTCFFSDDNPPYRRVKWNHDEPEAIQLMVSDNKLAEESVWNYQKLELNVEKLTLNGADLSLTGFDDNELKQVKNNANKEKLLDDYKQPKEVNKLSDDFIVPPFSVLDTKSKDWQDRKKIWKALIQNDGESREATLSSGIIAKVSDVSIFDPVLAEIIIKWFCTSKGDIFDPFSGGAFGFVSGYLGHNFTGIELRQEQVDINQERCNQFKLPCKYICEDAVNIDKHLDSESKDLMFSCPPYYDLEVYSDLDNDASNQGTYEDFLNILDTAFSKSIKILKENRFAVIVCGDIRDKKGFYRKFPDDIKNIFIANGMHLYNELILLDMFGTAAVRARKYFANRKTVKIHQNVLVFYKGNPTEIKRNYPEIPEISRLNDEN